VLHTSLCPSSEYLTNTLPVVEYNQERIVRVEPLQVYKDIFIKVKNWGKFEHSDIARNQLYDAQDIMVMPDLVTAFEQQVGQKATSTP